MNIVNINISSSFPRRATKKLIKMKVFFVLCVTMLFAVATFGQPVDLEDVGHMGEDHHIGK